MRFEMPFTPDWKGQEDFRFSIYNFHTFPHYSLKEEHRTFSDKYRYDIFVHAIVSATLESLLS